MSQRSEVVIIKIGGSSITNKATEETLNQDAINWFAKLISDSVHPSFLFSDQEVDDTSSSSRREKPKFVIVHGAGSFGHHSAKRHGLQCGKVAAAAAHPINNDNNSNDDDGDEQKKKRFQMEALSKTRHSVQKLNAAMVGTLLDHGVNAVGISPGVSIPGMRAYGSSTRIDGEEHNNNNNPRKSVAAMDLLCESINEALDAGLLPVIHGDACLLDDTHAGILGGDTLVEGLVGSEELTHKVQKVIFISDVAGVFSSDPKVDNDARLIRSLRVDIETGEVTIGDGVLSPEHSRALLARIKKLVIMWADEEQMQGNKVFYWNILNVDQQREIAHKVPTTLEELAECTVPKHFQTEYGDRLLKNINAYITLEDLEECIENRPTKRQKRVMDVSGSSHAHDVTGGLKAKLGAAVTAVKCGKEVVIAKCCSASAEKFIQGDSLSAEEGTMISKRNYPYLCSS